jgi:uncharacterized protein (TIGR02145 family)
MFFKFGGHMQKFKLFTAVALFFFASFSTVYPQIVLQGVVTDADSDPVQDVLVQLIDQADTTKVFKDSTNENGEYSIQIIESSVDDLDFQQPGSFKLYKNYPKPFNPTTVTSYDLLQPANVQIEIYNVLGQKTRTLVDEFQTNLIGRNVWDATDDKGRGVPAGVYIYSLIASDQRINKKMLLIDGHQSSSMQKRSKPLNTTSSSSLDLGKINSNNYILKVTRENIEPFMEELQISNNMIRNITVVRTTFKFETGTVTDIDGNVYKTVKIGDQWWMAENLKVTQYRNGDPIPHVTEYSKWSSNLTSGAYCEYDNNSSNVETYGRLYNWWAVNDSRNMAPAGWHVPTDAEWTILTDYLGESSIAGGKLKEEGFAHWGNPNSGATNESGLSALPGGYRDSTSGYYTSLGTYAYFWSSTEYGNNHAWNHNLNYYHSTVYRNSIGKQAGFSVRCVRD